MSKKLREQTGRNISIVVLENNRADVKLVEGLNVVTSVNLDGTARKNNYSKLTEDQVMLIQSLHRDKWSIAKISKHTGIARQTIAKYLKVL